MRTSGSFPYWNDKVRPNDKSAKLYESFNYPYSLKKRLFRILLPRWYFLMLIYHSIHFLYVYSQLEL